MTVQPIGPDPAAEPERIPVTSRLWKFMQLVNNSNYLPVLVQGAALMTRKEYTLALLAHVAANETVLNAIDLTFSDGVAEAVDPVLERLITTNGAGVDAVILDAVRNYSPPSAG